MDSREKQEIGRLIDSYSDLVSREQIAREDGDERHVDHCVKAQKQVRQELRRRLPA